MILLNKSVAKLHFSIVANLWLNFHLQRYPEISYSCTMSCLKKSSMSATPGDEARWPDQKKLAYLPTYPPTSLPTYLPPKCIFSNVYFVKMYFSKVYFSKVYFFKVYFSKCTRLTHLTLKALRVYFWRRLLLSSFSWLQTFNHLSEMLPNMPAPVLCYI